MSSSTIVKDEFIARVSMLQHLSNSQLMQNTQEKMTKVRRLIPYKNSAWKRYTQTFLGADKQGNLLRATMLSGGTVYTPFRMYESLIHHKVQDLKNDVIFTDVEWAHNCEGIRLFVELDYKTKDCLPTEEEVMSHLDHISNVIEECFPNSDKHQQRMHVAVCDPTGVVKTSDEKKSQDIFEEIYSSVIYKKWGIHVVFPDIVTTTQIMRRIAYAIDTRISRDSATWNNVVDSNAYKEMSATLRPPFSYKSTPCPICRSSQKRKKRKRKSSFDDTDNDPIVQLQTAHELLSNSCDCVFGYRLQPSTYEYVGTYLQNGTMDSELVSVSDILQGMSIIPSKLGSFTEEFTHCEDMGKVEDKLSNEGQVFRSEKRLLSATSRRNQIDIPVNEKQKCFQIVQSIINRICPEYRRVVVDNIRHCSSKQKNELFITVKGPGMRWCVLKQKEHNSNRAFFILCLLKLRLIANCFDKSCKKCETDKDTITVFPLSTKEIMQLKELPSTNVHIVQRKISSSSSTKHPHQTSSSSSSRSSSSSSINNKDIYSNLKSEAIERYNALKSTLDKLKTTTVEKNNTEENNK